jgi:tetratricopeptide (TPR) repeat protein
MFPRRSLAACLLLCALSVTGCTDKEAIKQASLKKADALAAQGNYAEAILEYRNALKADKRFGEARFKLAEAYGRAGDSQQALREYVRAADLLPENAEAQIRAASLLLAGQQFEPARKYAEKAVKADPKQVEGQILLAAAMAGLKDPTAAIDELEEAMANAPGDARPYVSMGSIKASLGNSKEAEAAFRKAIEIDPASIDARLALALYYWSAQRLPDAEAAIKGAIEIDRDSQSANRMLSTFYLQQDRKADAETPLLRLTNRKDPLGALSLADLYARTDRAAQARPLYEQVLGATALRSRATTRLATLDFVSGKQAEALTRLDAELKTNPGDAQVLAVKAQFLTRLHRLDEALEAAKKAATLAPQSPIPQFTLGGVLRERGDVDGAIAAFTEALKFDAHLPGADAQLASLYLARGNKDSALTHARAALELEPQNPSVRLQFAAALLATGNAAAAGRELTDLATQHPSLPSVHSLYGEALMAAGNWAEAAREYDMALAANPLDRRALAGRVTIDVKNRRPQDGRVRIAKAVQASGSADMLMLAARFEQGTGDNVNAEKFLRQVLQKDPSRLEAYQILGEMYAQQQRLDDARKEFEEVVKRQPQSIQARTMIGMILDAQQKPDQSIKIYESIVSGGGRAPVAANNLAWIYASRGEQLDVALELAQRAKQGLPESSAVDDTLGWIYYKKDMPELAIKSLEASVRKEPRNVMYQYHLGLAYAKAGQASKARQILQDALKRAPNVDGAEEARQALAALKG